MAKRTHLSKTLFFELWAKRSGLSVKTIKKVYEQMFLLMAEELKFNGEFELPDICRIETVSMGGKDRRMFDIGYVFVEAYEGIKFKVKDKLLDFVNGRAVSDTAKRRKKTNRLSTSDIKLKNLTYEQRKDDFESYLNSLEEEMANKGLKRTNRVNDEQLIRLIAKYTGMTIASVRTMKESESNVIKYQLKSGRKVGYGNIGKFGLELSPYVEEHDGKNPYTGEEVYVEAREPFYYPQMTFLPAFKQEVRELTEDNFV